MSEEAELASALLAPLGLDPSQVRSVQLNVGANQRATITVELVPTPEQTAAMAVGLAAATTGQVWTLERPARNDETTQHPRKREYSDLHRAG